MSDQPEPNQASGGVSDELRPYVDRAEAESIDRIGARLQAERPTLRPEYKVELRAHLERFASNKPSWRPKSLRLLVVTYVSSGMALLLIAAVGLAPN